MANRFSITGLSLQDLQSKYSNLRANRSIASLASVVAFAEQIYPFIEKKFSDFKNGIHEEIEEFYDGHFTLFAMQFSKYRWEFNEMRNTYFEFKKKENIELLYTMYHMNDIIV
jgi:hypothetical protein